MLIERERGPLLKPIDQLNIIKPEVCHINDIPTIFIAGGEQEIVRFEIIFAGGSFFQEKTLQSYTTAHMLRNGTKNKPSDQINKIWDYMGASVFTEAQKDFNSVGFYSLTRHLPEAIDLLLEMVKQPSFDQNELDIFLQNKKSDFLVDNEKVQHLARLRFNQLIYGENHPYGNQIKKESFDKILRKDLVDFHQKLFHKNNCVILVSGKIPLETRKLIQSKTIEFQSGIKNTSTSGIKPSTIKTQYNFLPKPNSTQSALRIGKICINRTHPDFHKLNIANTILGGFFGSRLMQKIRQEKGYTYGIYSILVSFLNSAYFVITAQVGNEVLKHSLYEIKKELKHFRTKNIEKSELQMIKNYLSGNVLKMFDGPFAQAERFKEVYLFNQDIDFYLNYLNEIKNFKSTDAPEMAEKYLHEDSMTQLVVGAKNPYS